MSEPEFDNAGIVARVADRLFGYDFFLSYSHGDGLELPRAVKARLEQAGFRVFLDQTDYVAGIDLRRETRRQVLKSRKMVVFGRPAALRSEWVRREVDVALAAGRYPVLVNVNRAVEGAPDDAYVARVAREQQWLLLNETSPQPDGAPSEHLVSELIRGFTHARQETKRMRVVSGVALVLATSAAVAGWQAVEARRAQAVAERNFETAKLAADSLVDDIARGLRDVQGLQVESVRRILQRAEAAFGKIAASAPDNPALLLSRSKMYNEFVETYLAQGDTASAREAAEASVTAARRLMEVAGGDPGSRRQLGLALLKLGDARDEVGEILGAGEAYAEALAVREAILAAALSDKRARREVGVALVRLADNAHRRRDLPAARAFYERALTIRRELAAAEPAWRRDLGLNLLVLGDILLEAGEVPGARTANEEALALFEKLRAEDRTATKAARDYAIALQRRGNIALRERDYAAARGAYEASRGVFVELSAGDPGNIEWRRDIGVADGKLAEVLAASGDREAAVALLEKIVAHREELARKSPDNHLFRIDLAEALRDLAAQLPPARAAAPRARAREILAALNARNLLGKEHLAWLAALEQGR